MSYRKEIIKFINQKREEMIKEKENLSIDQINCFIDEQISLIDRLHISHKEEIYNKIKNN